MNSQKVLPKLDLIIASLCISSILLLAAAPALAAPPIAPAAPVQAGTTLSAQPASPIDFVIGIPGKTGCLVCHGDPKITSSKTKNNVYVNPDTMAGSVHKDVACTSCHSDFTLFNVTQTHGRLTTDYKKVAGLSCKNCHQHSKQLQTYSQSLHGRLALSGDPKGGATCADCHGSHDIKSFKKDKAYKNAFHLAGNSVCGKCHQDYSNTYNDYYHGKAYNMKALDAPSCWDCHGAHNIAPAKDGTSMISQKRLAKTCGKCHHDSKQNFADFGRMIHGSKTIFNDNLAFAYANKLWSWLDLNVIKKVGLYYEQTKVALFYRQQK